MKNVENKIIQPVSQHLKRKRITTLSLSDPIKSILLGSLLGDGCLKIYSGYKNAKFSFRHSMVQKDYFYWKLVKMSALKEIQTETSFFSGTVSQSKPDGFSKNSKLIFQSPVSQDLTTLHSIVCKNNKLNIRRSWLNSLSNLSLAVWWFDDGSLICGRRRGVLCTDGFDEESCQILATYLSKVWSINVTVKPIFRNGKNYFRLWFKTTELKKFLKIILPEVPLIWDMFEKKMIIRYKDQRYQQRWISEIQEILKTREKTLESTELISRLSTLYESLSAKTEFSFRE
jgi:hypothetical protein